MAGRHERADAERERDVGEEIAEAAERIADLALAQRLERVEHLEEPGIDELVVGGFPGTVVEIVFEADLVGTEAFELLRKKRVFFLHVGPHRFGLLRESEPPA